MRFIVRYIIVFCIFFGNLQAQPISGAQECVEAKLHAYKQAAKTSVASLEENRYDVKYLLLDIALDNQSVAISGKATTVVEVLENNFGLYAFELNSELTIDSVYVNGQKAVFSRDADLVNVLTPTLLNTGASLSAEVFYHGSPSPGSVFFFQSGLNNATAETWGSKITYTLSEPYNAKDWYPCKQSLQDKIDSADIWITVPDSLKAGSNGVLQKVTSVAGNKSRYEWKTRYPIAYYLVSVSVGNYQDYSFTQKLPDGKEVLIQNYLYNRSGVMNAYKEKIDSTGLMLSYFSELFGTYPFYKEKYGHCMSPVFGGMEHQTMTTLHNFNTPLVSHELAHQWFGDNVTCATWKDIWLNEGFASYAEYLFVEKFHPAQNAHNYMLGVHKKILDDSVVTGSIYVPASDTFNPYRVFDSRLSYNKGSAVLHMLRYLIDDDQVFFSILKEYQQKYILGNASTEQFKQLASEISKINLDKFFSQWVYGEGYPIYNITWNQVGDRLYIQSEQQTAVPESVPFYNMPVQFVAVYEHHEIYLQTHNYEPTQTFVFAVDSNVEHLIFDPLNRILNKETVTRDYSLGVDSNPPKALVHPNPANGMWNVSNIAAGTLLVLTDLRGRVLLRVVATDNYGVSIPTAEYASGVYLLNIIDVNKGQTIKKLLK